MYKKLIGAMKLAIQALEKERRVYSPGHVAYRQGIRTITLDSDGITGELFSWVEQDAETFEKYSAAIDTLNDWIEAFGDEGPQFQQLPLDGAETGA